MNTTEFLAAIFADSISSERQLSIFCLPSRTVRRFDNAEAAAKFGLAQAKTEDVYFGLGLIKSNPKGRGILKDIVGIGCLWADIDIADEQHSKPNLPPSIEEAEKILGSIPLEPSIIVNSGGGLHVYWLFKEPWMFDTDKEQTAAALLCKRISATLRSTASKYGYDLDSVGDLTRLLRLPGTINHKYPTQPTVQIYKMNTSIYNPDDFENILIDEKLCSSNQIIKVDDIVLRADAEPPQNKFLALLENDSKFKASWTRVRKDLPDQSASSYCLSLASIAAATRWTDQETANLIIAWRRTYSDKPEKALRWDWMQRTIIKARTISEPQETKEDSITAGRANTHTTEYGLARRFILKHYQNVRYCHTWKSWLIYDGRRWKRDEDGEIKRRMKEVTQAIFDKGMRETDNSDERDRLLKFAIKCEALRIQENALKLAESEKEVASIASQFDRNTMLLNCSNGTLDLSTGILRPHRSKDMITKLAPVRYDPTAQLSLWDKFLADTTSGDEEFLAFLQRCVGYSLTGKTLEESLFFVYGPTCSGKSTFLAALKAALGDYASTANFECFLARNQQTGGPRNDIARLVGQRLVVSTEVDEGKKMAEGLLKLITGGDTIAARFLYQEEFEFQPQFKLWLCANTRPKLRDNDDALWRRIHIVPFAHTIPKDQRDPQVKATLSNPDEAGAAILAWAVQGCLAWQKEGLGTSEATDKATIDYKEEMDPLAPFLADCCIEGVYCEVTRTNIRQAYNTWAKQNKEWPMKIREFTQRLRTREYTEIGLKIGGHVVRGWRGVGLRSSVPSEAESGEYEM